MDASRVVILLRRRTTKWMLCKDHPVFVKQLNEASLVCHTTGPKALNVLCTEHLAQRRHIK